MKSKKRRLELKLTQEDLAKRLHVTRAAVSNWEQGRNHPDITLLVKLSDALGLSLDALLRGDEAMVKRLDEQIKKGRFFEQYYLVGLSIIGMSAIGYYAFDDLLATLIFGIGTGGVFGYIIDSIGKKKTKKS